MTRDKQAYQRLKYTFNAGLGEKVGSHFRAERQNSNITQIIYYPLSNEGIHANEICKMMWG
jgi:hypothetical protein